MRHLRIHLTALVLALCIAGLTPSGVHAQGAELPQLAPLRSVRENFVLTFNGRPLQVCQREWQSWNRLHGVCRDLATATLPGRQLIAGSLVEFVVFDGTLYQRVADQTTWTASPDPNFAPDLTLNEGLFDIGSQAELSYSGPADVAGTPATQYQYWSLDEALNTSSGGQLVYDLFLSTGSTVLKSQVSVRGSIAGMGEGDLSEVRTFSDFNTSITIVAPT